MEKSFLVLNGEMFRHIHFANCQTHGIVYMMACECGAFYIGKTKQEFWQRISKHVYSMQIGNRYLPIGRHVVLKHDYRMLKVTFTTLDRIHTKSRWRLELNIAPAGSILVAEVWPRDLLLLCFTG